MSKKNQNYTNRKQNRFQPERMRGNIFVNNSGKQWLPGKNGRAAKVERLLRGLEKKEIAGNMAGYKDSGIEYIGQVPKDWEVLRLKNISNIYAAKEYLFGEWPVEKNGKPYSPFGEWSSGNEVIITGRVGTIGQYEMLEKNPKKKILINDNRLLIRPFTEDYRKKALSHFLFWAMAIVNLNDIITGSAVPLITATSLLKKRIVVPPLSEQQRIADFLDTKCGILDRTIDAVSQQIEDLEKYKKALITKTVTKGICKKGEPERAMKDSGVEWIGEVPEEWSVKPFKALAGMKGSSEYTARDIVDEGEGAILLSPSNINDNKLNLSKRTYISQKKYDKSTTKIHRGDLLFTKTASVGKCVIYDSDEPAMPNPQLVVLKNIKCLPKFLYYSMVSDVMQAPAKMYVYGSVIPTISQLNLGRIKIPVPSPEEQQQIADYLDEKCKNIDNRVKKRRQQLEWLKEYKKSLIFDYVTGKKRVEK